MSQLALDYSDVGAPRGYFPELDYRGTGYQPFLGSKCKFCDRCKEYYDKLYAAGVTREFCDEENQELEDGSLNPEPKFLPVCIGAANDRQELYTADDFEDSEQYYKAMTLLDPVAWAKVEFNWDARWYQAEFLRCTSQFRAFRAGRRVGKTEGLAIYILWKLFTNKNYQVLVIAPYQPQVKKIFEMIRLFMSMSISLAGKMPTDRESPYEQIKIPNGSSVRGFSSGARTGARSDKIRGQDANEIVIDEVDYLADEDLEVISAILASNADTTLLVASTPTGIRQKLHTWCTEKTQRFKEFWFIAAESPSWTKKAERYFRSNYSEGGYLREFLAEFGTEMMGVFRGGDLQAALRDYGYEECSYDSDRRYIIGVDWNKITGTHIIVVEQRWDAQRQAVYRPVDKVVIRKSEFTQHNAVKAILTLDKKWHCSFIYVDAGYGDVQIEMLRKYDKDHPAEKTNLRKRVMPVQMGGKTIIKNPITGEDEKKETKPLFVNLLAIQLEQRRIELPRKEDTQTRIIPEELGLIDIGLVQQMREFKVTKYSPQGRPTYSQDFEHTLTAFMCAVGGFVLNFSDMGRATYSHQIRSLSFGGSGVSEDAHTAKADRARRRERLAPQERVGGFDHGKV